MPHPTPRDWHALRLDLLPSIPPQLEVSPGQWEWLRVDIRGDKSFMFMGKVATSRRIGVPLRDLRMLEPQLVGQYPNTIMSRDKVILVNLAPILCVIGTKEMFMLNFKEPVSSRAVDALVEKLQGKVAHHSVEEQAPFELVCLECVLQALIKHLGDVVAEHEISAHTTMDALVNQVTRLGLESVRKIKTKLASSVENIESLRSLLEKLLESSASMLGLYLSSPELVDEEVKAAMDEELADDDADLAAPLAPMDRETRMAMMQQARKAIQDEVEQEYVEDVEMLLEAYLVQVGLLTKKVAAISQYMDDTQDFIHANQDNQRNQLLVRRWHASARLRRAGTEAMQLHLPCTADAQHHRYVRRVLHWDHIGYQWTLWDEHLASGRPRI